MKISDKELQILKQWLIEEKAASKSEAFQTLAAGAANAITELQQHRADKRWRKIADEIPHLGEKVLLFLNNGDYDIGMMRLRGIQANTYGLVDERDDINIVAWKPLPTDLPEEE